MERSRSVPSRPSADESPPFQEEQPSLLILPIQAWSHGDSALSDVFTSHISDKTDTMKSTATELIATILTTHFHGILKTKTLGHISHFLR